MHDAAGVFVLTFIAAEIGVNWRNLSEAKRMIGLAQAAGADAVKFQCYLGEHVKGHPREAELIEKVLKQTDLQLLKDTADECGIEFFATPMYPEAVDMLESIGGIKRYKIRFADRHNMSLISKIISTGKPYLISCDDEYVNSSAPQEIWDEDPDKRKFIYCVPEYPPKTVKLPATFLNFGSLFHGYSNHYPSISIPLAAAARGAEYIEVHMKKGKYYDGYRPIDDAVSIAFSELGELVIMIWEIEKVLK